MPYCRTCNSDTNILKNLSIFIQYALDFNALFKRILSTFDAKNFEAVSSNHNSMNKSVFLSSGPHQFPTVLLIINIFISSSNLTEFHIFACEFSTNFLIWIIKQISSYFVYLPPYSLPQLFFPLILNPPYSLFLTNLFPFLPSHSFLFPDLFL